MSNVLRPYNGFSSGFHMAQFHKELLTAVTGLYGMSLVGPDASSATLYIEFDHILSFLEIAAIDAKIAAHMAQTLPRTNIISTHNQVDPTPTDDSSFGYFIGASWINLSADTEWVCVDDTVGAAVWKDRVSCCDDPSTTSSVISFIEDIYVSSPSNQYVASFYSTSTTAIIKFFTDGDPMVNGQTASPGYNTFNYTVAPGLVSIIVKKGLANSTIKGLTVTASVAVTPISTGLVSFIEDIYVSSPSDQYVASFYATTTAATLRFFTDGTPTVNGQVASAGYNTLNYTVPLGLVDILVKKGATNSTIKGMTIVASATPTPTGTALVSFIEDIYVSSPSNQYIASFYASGTTATIQFSTDGDPMINGQTASPGYNTFNYVVSPGLVGIIVKKGLTNSTIKGMTITA